jgi:hypothetical protein
MTRTKAQAILYSMILVWLQRVMEQWVIVLYRVSILLCSEWTRQRLPRIKLWQCVDTQSWNSLRYGVIQCGLSIVTLDGPRLLCHVLWKSVEEHRETRWVRLWYYTGWSKYSYSEWDRLRLKSVMLRECFEEYRDSQWTKPWYYMQLDMTALRSVVLTSVLRRRVVKLWV